MRQTRPPRTVPPECFALDLRQLAAFCGMADPSAGFGIDRATLEDPEALVPITVYYDAVERAAAHRGDPHLGFHFALHWAQVARGGVGAMHFLLLSSPSLRVACERLLCYQHYWNRAEWYELAPAARTYAIRYRCWGPTREAHAHQAEKTAALIFLVARGADPNAEVVAVTFPHARRGDDAELTELFGVAPNYGGPWTEVVVPAPVMEKALPQANPALFEMMDRYVRKEMAALPASDSSFTPRAVAAVRRLLHQGDFQPEQVASTLGCGMRTLSRRLAAEGTTLREIVDAVRKGRAEALLEANVAISEVAFLLGYSEPAAFQHAFRRWHGVSARAWLARRRSGPVAEAETG